APLRELLPPQSLARFQKEFSRRGAGIAETEDQKEPGTERAPPCLFSAHSASLREVLSPQSPACFQKEFSRRGAGIAEMDHQKEASAGRARPSLSSALSASLRERLPPQAAARAVSAAAAPLRVPNWTVVNAARSLRV